MRDFFIRSFELIISAFIILMSIGVVVSGLGVMFGGGMQGQGGFFAGIMTLVFGGLFVLFIGGSMYLGLGIYQNTKRTADAVEKLASRSVLP
jgi:hypothetical protein